jgi:hypothetical protein
LAQGASGFPASTRTGDASTSSRLKQRNNSGIPVQDPDIMLRRVAFEELARVACHFMHSCSQSYECVISFRTSSLVCTKIFLNIKATALSISRPVAPVSSVAGGDDTTPPKTLSSEFKHCSLRFGCKCIDRKFGSYFSKFWALLFKCCRHFSMNIRGKIKTGIELNSGLFIHLTLISGLQQFFSSQPAWQRWLWGGLPRKVERTGGRI